MVWNFGLQRVGIRLNRALALPIKGIGSRTTSPSRTLPTTTDVIFSSGPRFAAPSLTMMSSKTAVERAFESTGKNVATAKTESAKIRKCVVLIIAANNDWIATRVKTDLESEPSRGTFLKWEEAYEPGSLFLPLYQSPRSSSPIISAKPMTRTKRSRVSNWRLSSEL